MEVRWLPFAQEKLEVVVIAVMHCKQSPATVNRTIRYVLDNYM